MDDLVVKCIRDLMTKVAKVPAVTKAIYHINAEEDVVEITKGMQFPCVGVIYEGMRAVTDNPQKMGVSAEIVCALMVFDRAGPSFAAKDMVATSLILMDDIRNTIKLTKSPTGHFWGFQMEASMGSHKGILAYIQRWTTAAILS